MRGTNTNTNTITNKDTNTQAQLHMVLMQQIIKWPWIEALQCLDGRYVTRIGYFCTLIEPPMPGATRKNMQGIVARANLFYATNV